MRLLGRWSLASWIRVAIDLSYYLLFMAVAVVFAIALWAALAHWQDLSVQYEVPVQFQLDPVSHPIVVARHDLQAVSITGTHGTLVITGRVSTLAFVGLGFAIITLGVALFVLTRLRAIFRTLRDQNPFVASNASGIRMIGLVLVLGTLATTAFRAWVASRVTGEISVAGLTFQREWSINPPVIFAGLILLILAEVFRLGSEMKGDLETARKIQLDLVPGETFRKNNAVVQARMRPARIVGGDYYDLVELDERRLAVIVGDVTGKGLSAAMLMASVLGSVRALCSAGLRGSGLIAALNKHVCAEASDDRLVTLFYGELDTATGQMSYVNAGHNAPILLRSDGQVDRLQSTSMVLGAMADAPMECRNIEIEPGDRLLLFTDGFPEAFNKKDEEYGEARLTESFTRVRTLPLSLVVERLIADVLKFLGSVQPADDMTLMLVERQPA
jgi:serine phosphatase RsbU (regulator of sigma subunit)